MGKRVNIGIYISPNDVDIAAWFNMLKRNHQSYTRWVKALLAAYALNDSLRIGVIDCKAPLIRGKNGEVGRNTVDKKGAFHYGWQVKGPAGEFVIGSVINISVSKQDLQPVLEEAWSNGHKLSTFIKSLIRKNLKAADKDIPPRIEEYSRVWSAYLVSVNSKNTDPDRNPALQQAAPKETNSWVTSEPPASLETDSIDVPGRHAKPVQSVQPVEEQKPHKSAAAHQEPVNSDRFFAFAEEETEDKETAAPEPVPQSGSALGLNPLVGMI